MMMQRREEFPRLRFGLVQRLQSVRRRMRFALIVEATARMVTAILVVFAFAAFLDWLVRFPVILRTIFLCVGAAWTGVHAYRRIWRPMIAPVPLDELALALHGLPGQTRDEWASTLRYLSHGAAGSQEMWSRVVAETEHAASQAVPSRLVRIRPAILSGLAAAACSMIVVLIGLWAPWVVLTGADRLARPMSGAQWPKKRVIEPLTRDAVVAWSETFTVQMRLASGDDPNVRGYVYWQAGSNPRELALLRRDPDGVYRMTLENVRQPIRYSFKAGDDDTSNEPFLLRVVKRPEVETEWLTLSPPSYASHLPITTDSLQGLEAEALVGSMARLVVRPSKLISGEGASRAEILFDNENRVPLKRVDDSSTLLAAEFPVDQNRAFQVHLVDAQGMESRSSPIYRLRVRPDEPPVVHVVEPESVIEATASAIIEFRVIAQDDVGLSDVRLLFGKAGEEVAPSAKLLSSGAFDDASPPARVELSHAWNLSELPLAIGDVLEYAAEARDVCSSEGVHREPSRTAAGRIHIISAARLAERLQMELMSVREQLRSLMTALQDSRDRTDALDAGPSRQMPLNDIQRGEAEHLATGLQRLRELSESHVAALSELKRQAERNQLRSSTAADQAERLARRLDDSAPPALQEAASALNRSAQSDQADTQHEQLKASAEIQSDLLSTLRAMVREMDQWSEYEDFVRLLREVLDRQELLERETTQVARRSGGQSAERLEASVQQEIVRITSAQLQLRGETSRLVASMLDWAGKKSDEDRASGESLRNAVTVGYRLSLLEKMDEAAGAIQSGQAGGAAEAQRDAAAALRAMIAALGDRLDRQLAELSRDLADLTGRLRRLLRSQETLNERCKEAQEAEDSAQQLEELADRQINLATAARRVATLLKQDDDDARHAREQVSIAAVEMKAAGEGLDMGEFVAAGSHQLASVAALKEALTALGDYQDRVDQEVGQRSLEALVEAMIDVRRKQQALRAETANIRLRQDTDGMPTRADGLRLSRLSRLQRELIDPVEQIRDKAGASIVYIFILDRVLGSMEAAAVRLAAHDGGGAMTEQDRIIRDLGRLIEAAQDQRDDKQSRFVQDSAGGGGGAAGQPTASKPVPTLAELKVLKVLQVDVSEATSGLSAKMPESQMRSERELREIESLGRQQREIRELANRMVDRAAEGR